MEQSSHLDQCSTWPASLISCAAVCSSMKSLFLAAPFVSSLENVSVSCSSSTSLFHARHKRILLWKLKVFVQDSIINAWITILIHQILVGEDLALISISFGKLLTVTRFVKTQTSNLFVIIQCLSILFQRKGKKRKGKELNFKCLVDLALEH